jgi:glycosyltransferase involved in cell wall biosynthesis
MRILFATTLLPAAEHSGGELVSLALINALRDLGHHVTAIGYLRPGAVALMDADSLVVEHRPVETAASGARAIGWLAESFARNIPYTSAKFRSGRYATMIADLCAARRVEAVIVDHTQMWWLREHVPAHIPAILMMHNAESELYASGAARARSAIRGALYRREARLLGDLEMQGASESGIWVLSAADAASVRERVPGASVSVLPVIPAARFERGVDAAFDVGLLATWTWQPNADALRWFVSEVLPRLPRTASVRVAGPGAEWLRGRDPRVTYVGFVDDASAFLRSAKVIAVPTQYGGGVETKMFTAIATGRPIVATSTSTRGLGNLPQSVSVVDDANAFAQAIAASLAMPDNAGDQAAAWWQKRRDEFLKALEADMRNLVPAVRRVPGRIENTELVRRVA